MNVRILLSAARRRRMLALAAGALAAGSLAVAPAAAAPAGGVPEVAAPAAAPVLMPHKATYRLSLDGSRASSMVDDMSGEIAYEITGDACAGYTTRTRQKSEGVSERAVTTQEVTATAWESGDATSYRFHSASTSSGDDDDREIEASVTRSAPDGLKVVVTRSGNRTIDLKGRILLPTEHVRMVLDAAGKGQKTFQAKVYDGTTDPAKVFDTLAVIGRPSRDEARISEPAARAALAGHTYYPVTVSYFEGAADQPPAYVMSYALYDNGVVGDLKIDYGRFTVTGKLASFEPLKPAADCGK